ncbi:MAG: hypothetical protein J6V76_04590 [Bacteroidales bacterium]|nr:hypothetical protein [Bacteroidales bacterium]
MKKLLSAISLIIICALQSAAQTNPKIDIVNSNTLEVNETYGPDIKILRGDVVFYHDSAYMYCDSALYNNKENFFKAFGRIHIERLMSDNDTVHLWSDSASYNGNTKLATARKNVKMTRDSMVMLTENLDFDMTANVAYYFDGGTTFSGEDTLISDFGHFYPNTNDLKYTRDVEIHNPDYLMRSDTLTYNVKTKISNFIGPTEIISENDYLYTERGWFNHIYDQGQLTKNNYMTSNERRLDADTIFYDRARNYGYGRSNVEITDTVKAIKLLGDEAHYYDQDQKSVLTEKALMIYYSDIDTLYLHADTICSYMVPYLEENPDSLYRMVKAYHKTKMFRRDIQAMCDSMVYDFSDSTITMNRKPVIWHNENQITSENMKFYTSNNHIDMVELLNNAFVISEVDSLGHYDQIYGKNMVAYLDSNKIQEVEVISSANTIYYTEEDSIATGMNVISSQDMNIHFKKGKVDKIWFYKKPKGTIYPLEGLTKRQQFLDGFVWYDKHRPHRREDVFIWGEITEKPITAQQLEEEEKAAKEAEEEMEEF